MTTHTLSGLYSGLLPFNGAIDFSTLSKLPTDQEIRNHVKETVNSVQWKRIQNTPETIHSMPFLTLEDENYPSILRDTPFAPPVLFYKGNLELLEQSSIAIVGSRHCSKDSLSLQAESLGQRTVLIASSVD